MFSKHVAKATVVDSKKRTNNPCVQLKCEALEARVTPATLVEFALEIYIATGSYVYDETQIDPSVSSQTVALIDYAGEADGQQFFASSNATATFAYGQMVDVDAILDFGGGHTWSLHADIDQNIFYYVDSSVGEEWSSPYSQAATTTLSISTQPYRKTGDPAEKVSFGVTYANAPNGAYMSYVMINTATGDVLARADDVACNTANATLSTALSAAMTDRGRTIKIELYLYNSQGKQLLKATSDLYQIPLQ